MYSPFKFLSASDIPARSNGDVSYIRALTACRNNEIPCQKQGNSYVIYESDADEFIAKCRAQNDPELVSKLRARIASLEERIVRMGGTV